MTLDEQTTDGKAVLTHLETCERYELPAPAPGKSWKLDFDDDGWAYVTYAGERTYTFVLSPVVLANGLHLAVVCVIESFCLRMLFRLLVLLLLLA